MHVAEAVPIPSMTNRELISYLHSDLFIPDLKARNKNDAIHRMVDHLVAAKRVRNGKIVLEALKTREKMGSTGIGKGVAIPHSRSTVTNSLTLLFARSEEGVDYNAIDDKPVHLLFMILAPHQEKSSEYLPLLGKIVEATRDATVRKKLLKAEGIEGITEVFEKVKAR
ncbi:MAG TPA: PTS sugar transporter subunit IIA [Candidatus Polarisedimenticolia bacterium]|nr:PTS sugar transporter subunit IIA [Candidatus Polarisedimenticolia bacterium]